jgi:tetratricopeptide (TPR) repeat protein
MAVAAAVYAPTLSYDFVYDDTTQIEMAQSRFTWSQVPDYFTTDVWKYTSNTPGNYYRPVFLVWLMLNFQVFGLAAAAWHATTIAMHVLATLLVYMLAWKLIRDPLIAGTSALLFGVHTVHVEAVAWISGVTEPLFAVLSLGMLVAYIEWRERHDSRWRIISVALFALAIFAKETAIVLPLMVLAYEWIFGAAKCSWPARLRDTFGRVLPFLQIAIAYLGVRLLVLGAISPRIAQWRLATIVLTLPEVTWFYIRELIWPTRLGMFHDLFPVRRDTLADFFIPGLIVAPWAAVAAWLWKRRDAAAFACALLIVPLLPVLNLRVFGFVDFVHDRYLYLPSAGLCILIAIGLSSIVSARGTVVVAVLTAPLLCWLTIRECRYWENNLTLGEHLMEVAPNNKLSVSAYAGALVLAERWVDALPILKQEAAKRPLDDSILYMEAVCQQSLGVWSEAIQNLHRVLELDPDHPHARMLLGMSEEGAGYLDQAEADMREAIRRRPRASAQYRSYHANLAGVLEKKGDLKGAIAEYEAELAENPDEAAILQKLAALRGKISN